MIDKKDLETKGRLCAKCWQKAVYINGADIPVCVAHDMEDIPNKEFREALQGIGFPV